MEKVKNLEAVVVVDRMIKAIQENKQYLSDIDGEIGDGDHGINMNKGFSMAREQLEREPGNLSHGLTTLASVLMMKIGGSMGPLYGKIFKAIGMTFSGHEAIDAELFRDALNKIMNDMGSLSQARIGDKTLVDALYPAIDAYNRALDDGKSFSDSLTAMKKAAEEGRDSTRDMVAKIGRSSRLGERSRGVIDAGAASCALLLGVIADTFSELMQNKS